VGSAGGRTADQSGAISAADREKIIASATDYIEAWLDSDPARMARCLHPELIKRSVETDPDTGLRTVDVLTRDVMVEATRKERRLARPYEVTLLDAYGDIATVKVLSSAYMDYLHVARWGDGWLLLNVLWQGRVEV